jgi:hypothetical protein
MKSLLLILSLPTENATARMRAWRGLKACGAAVLRDGVYVLPAQEDCCASLAGIADDVRSNGGTAYLLDANLEEGVDVAALFDRGADFASLLTEISQCRDALSAASAAESLKRARKLRKAFAQIAAIDFFPGEAQRQTDAALESLGAAIVALLAPDEPRAVDGRIESLAVADFQRRLWATRARPWVDRLACAWLIRRFIDTRARFLWLASPADCPAEALGFDFDGARFTHVDGKVSFETLAASFGLESAAIRRVAAIVHFLDAGGIEPADAAGVERVLRGLRAATADDDTLLNLACGIFDGLHAAFLEESGS